MHLIKCFHTSGSPQIFSLFWRSPRFSRCWGRTGRSGSPCRASPQTRSRLRTWRAPGSPPGRRRRHFRAPGARPRSGSASSRWRSAPHRPSSSLLELRARTGLNSLLSSRGCMEMSCLEACFASRRFFYLWGTNIRRRRFRCTQTKRLRKRYTVLDINRKLYYEDYYVCFLFTLCFGAATGTDWRLHLDCR